MVRRSWSFLFPVLIAGCSASSLPGKLVGESAHFRLFVDPDLGPMLAPSQQGQPALDALETDWADKQTMLKMPEGQQKIDYHLMTGQHIAEVCDVEFVGTKTPPGCEVAGALQIATGDLPQQHELMHAYMELVAPGPLPIPFLAEGTAQAIGCNTKAGTDLTYDVPWQQAVVGVGRETPADVYVEGGLFARYLIRTQGIDTFVRYYRQAPRRRDPALFAANFSAFWSMTVDDVWAAMHVVQPGAASTDDSICPCSLSALPTDGQPIPSDVAHPYWTIGDTQGASIGVTAPGGAPIFVRDCEGVTSVLTVDPGFSTPQIADANVAIIQLADGRPHYITATISSASAGNYLADSCAGPTPYALPADFLSGPGNVSVLFSPVPAVNVRAYLQLQVPFAGQVAPAAGVAICGSCDFTPGSCPFFPFPNVTSTVAPGPLDVTVLPSQLPYGTTAVFGNGVILHFTN